MQKSEGKKKRYMPGYATCMYDNKYLSALLSRAVLIDSNHAAAILELKQGLGG